MWRCNYKGSVMAQAIMPTTEEAETGKFGVQGLPGLQSEFNSRLGSLVGPITKWKKVAGDIPQGHNTCLTSMAL